MENALAVRNNTTAIKSYDDLERAASAMAKSGYFQDSRDMAQAVVKILAGQEMGFGPFASMTGVYIISGRPSVGANLMAAAVKKSGRYNYRVVEMTEQVCTIEFTESGKPCGTSRFTLEDARKAGTKNLDKYARNMLFARAISNGVRWFCPDVFNGSAVYTPEELGANVNEEGDVIDMPMQPPAPTNGKAHEPEPAAAAPAEIAAWDQGAFLRLAKEYGLPNPRLESTLKYCNLPKPSTYDELNAWIGMYKHGRDQQMTPQEAAAEANAAMIPAAN